MQENAILQYIITHLPNLVVAAVFLYYLVTSVGKKDDIIAAKDSLIQKLNEQITGKTVQTEQLIQALSMVNTELQALKAEVRHKISSNPGE